MSMGDLRHLTTIAITNTSMHGPDFRLPSWIAFGTTAAPPNSHVLDPRARPSSAVAYRRAVASATTVQPLAYETHIGGASSVGFLDLCRLQGERFATSAYITAY